MGCRFVAFGEGPIGQEDYIGTEDFDLSADVLLVFAYNGDTIMQLHKFHRHESTSYTHMAHYLPDYILSCLSFSYWPLPMIFFHRAISILTRKLFPFDLQNDAPIFSHPYREL